MRFLQEIVGHKQIVSTLINAVAQCRVVHAYLFTGPDGVGKETTAMAFARALLCSSPVSGDACGKCRACRQVEHQNHPDLTYVHPVGKSIKIEQIREIQRRVPYRSYQGGRKIFLLCQADTMTDEAANCLLRTLEEPPGDTVFILVSSRPQALLSTILSRCQQFIFKGIPVPGLVQGLVSLHGLTEDAARIPAALSGGSMGKALAYAGGSFNEERGTVMLLVDLLGNSGSLEALERAHTLSEKKEKVQPVLDMLTCWYRDLLVYKKTGLSELLFNPDRLDTIMKEAGCFETGLLLEIIDSIEAAKQKIEANANPRLALEALFLSISRKLSYGGA